MTPIRFQNITKTILFWGIMNFAIISHQNVWAIGPKPIEPQAPLASMKPQEMEGVGIEENLGGTIDLDLHFTREDGQSVPLRSFFIDGKPVLLALIYYSCPTLCSLQLNGVTDSLREMEWTVGNEFNLITVSIDPTEDHQLASQKREGYLKKYGRYQAKDGWHLLVGQQENITKLANQVGFKYKYDETTKQYVHNAASYIITPKGRISYYHYGISPDSKVLRLSLVEASENRIGTIMDRMVLFCLQYDPNKKGYALYAMNIMRAMGVLIIIFFGGYLARFWFKQKNKKQTSNARMKES